jgi:hypothetical protein
MNLKGCRHLSVSKAGVSNSASPRTGSPLDMKITSINVPGTSGLDSRSRPPVKEIVRNLPRP